MGEALDEPDALGSRRRVLGRFCETGRMNWVRNICDSPTWMGLGPLGAFLGGIASGGGDVETCDCVAFPACHAQMSSSSNLKRALSPSTEPSERPTKMATTEVDAAPPAPTATLLVKRVSDKGRAPTRGSALAAGYDLYR